MEYGRNGRVVLYLALPNKYENAVDVVENVFSLAILANEVVAPGRGVQNLEVAARIRIATARVVGVVLDLATENGLAGAALDDVEDEEQLEIHVQVVINLKVLDIKFQELLFIK